MNKMKLVSDICLIAQQAGEAILNIYESEDFEVQLKGDQSPLTAADVAAHTIISAELEKLDVSLPILSEESDVISYKNRSSWDRFWLVDPLDGTKEFIKRNGEFTVNIALIEKGVPTMGVVFAPVPQMLYWGVEGEGAWKAKGTNAETPLEVASSQSGLLKVVASRSHRSEELEAYLAKLPEHECIAMGSSLKLCLVADGSAHLYPRIGPTMEWDTGAADAIVRAAGGTVTTLDGTALLYNKTSLLNPYFIVHSKVI